MTMNNAELLAEAKQRVALLSASLPTVIDPASISYTAKTPYKILCFREAMIWRTEEFAGIACDLFGGPKIASAMKMTRGCTENAAAVWYLKELVEKAINERDVTGLDDRSMQLLLGSRNEITALPAINVLTFVDRVDKKVPGFRKSYDGLCEYAHPNWAGTTRLFLKNDEEQILTQVGRNLRDHAPVVCFGLNCLNGSLLAFEQVYNEITDLIPQLIKLCEETLISARVELAKRKAATVSHPSRTSAARPRSATVEALLSWVAGWSEVMGVVGVLWTMSLEAAL